MLLDFYPLPSVTLKTGFPERHVHARNGFLTCNPERLVSLSTPGNFRRKTSPFQRRRILDIFNMFMLQKSGSLCLPATSKNS